MRRAMQMWRPSFATHRRRRVSLRLDQAEDARPGSHDGNEHAEGHHGRQQLSEVVRPVAADAAGSKPTFHRRSLARRADDALIDDVATLKPGYNASGED